MGGVEVELVQVTEADKSVLANLVQFYRYDFSPIRHFELTDHGGFVYRYLDHYFVDGSDREPCFIRHRGRLAGFTMTRAKGEGAVALREVAEFFVVRAHRRCGVGRAAAVLMFNRHPGRWEVAWDDDNAEAAAFWPVAVATVAVGVVARAPDGPPHRTYRQTVLRFATR
jgi:predicted acetyltransferase